MQVELDCGIDFGSEGDLNSSVALTLRGGAWDIELNGGIGFGVTFWFILEIYKAKDSINSTHYIIFCCHFKNN